MTSFAELEESFTVSRDVLMARDGAAKRRGQRSNKKLCFVSTNKEHLVRLLFELSSRDDCCWVKYSISPHDGMYLGRVFMTTDEIVGRLWAQYKAADKVYCTVQDDDFTQRFRDKA
jgi:hypothetical protein